MFLLFFSFIFAECYFPNDPEFSSQFTINNTVLGRNLKSGINILPVWEEGIFGDNINIGVIGKGCNVNHLDLPTSRYQETLSYNFDSENNDISVYEQDAEKGKTTGFLGIAAASRNNSVSIHGIAPEANFYCIKQTYSKNYTKIAQSIEHENSKTDVKLLTMPHTCDNMYSSIFASCDGPSPNQDVETAIEANPKMIVVSPVGDDAISGIDANFFPDVKHPDVISVSDITPLGIRSYWSTRGTCIVCNAYAGGNFGIYGTKRKIPILPTISVEGGDRSVPPDTEIYGYDSIGAGSASVAGVVALMKEVNKELEAKDIRSIIAMTSNVNDPLHDSWVKNKGEFYYSDVYGFGTIDAEKCVNMSKQWKKLGNLQSNFYRFMDTQLYTTRGGITSVIGSIQDPSKRLKFIDYAILEFEYYNVGNLRISVISSQGTEAHVVTPSNVKDTSGKVTYTIRNFFGEELTNTPFKLLISRDGYGNQTYVKNIKLTVYGYEETPEILKQGSTQQILPHNREMIPSTQNLILTFNTTTNSSDITCDDDVFVSLYSTDGFTSNEELELYLYDIDRLSFYQLDKTIKIGETTTISFPCILINKKLYLYALNREYSLSANTMFNLINENNETGSFIEPKAYTIFHRDESQFSITIDLKFSLNMQYFSSDPEAQAVLVGIFDLETKQNIYSTPMLLSEAKSFTFTISKDYNKAVLYLMPQWHTNYTGCSTIIQPIRILVAGVAPDDYFEVPLSSMCEVPPGIISTEELPLSPDSSIDTSTDIMKYIYIDIFIAVIVAIVIGYFIYKFCRQGRALNKIDDSQLGEYAAAESVLEP